MRHSKRSLLGSSLNGLVAVLALLALGACSSEPGEPETTEEHVWKGQTEAIDKAREVETILKRDQSKEN